MYATLPCDHEKLFGDDDGEYGRRLTIAFAQEPRRCSGQPEVGITHHEIEWLGIPSWNAGLIVSIAESDGAP